MNRSSTKTFLKGGLLTAIGALVLVGTVGNSADHANAEELNFSATIRPSLLVEIPTDTIKLEVQPELGKDTFAKMAMNVVVSTNNPTGYQMNATADSTDLTKIEADNNGVFAKIKTLDSLAGGYTEETFTPNRWGYKIDDGSYLPFSTNTNLINTTSPANGEETTITFGAKVNMDQPYGIYELTLNFQTVANVVPTYMQGYTLDQCQAEASSAPVELTDSRDGKVYRVRYINGVCTMIDNLRVDKGTLLTPADTNINSNWTMTDRDLTTGDNSYDLPEIHEGDATTGHWYNYAAATAGTITGSSNTTEATQDICPKGWKLPDGHNTGVAGATTLDQYKLANNKWQSYDKTYQTVFNSVAAGAYYGGSLYDSGSYGVWWSSTASTTTLRYLLLYNTSNGLYSGDSNDRGSGYSVRCVLGS